jgi:hypothetical protein
VGVPVIVSPLCTRASPVLSAPLRRRGRPKLSGIARVLRLLRAWSWWAFALGSSAGVLVIVSPSCTQASSVHSVPLHNRARPKLSGIARVLRLLRAWSWWAFALGSSAGVPVIVSPLCTRASSVLSVPLHNRARPKLSGIDRVLRLLRAWSWWAFTFGSSAGVPAVLSPLGTRASSVPSAPLHHFSFESSAGVPVVVSPLCTRVGFDVAEPGTPPSGCWP